MAGTSRSSARWPDFTSRLASTLSGLPEDSRLILDVRPPAASPEAETEDQEGTYSIELQQGGRRGFRAEASSDLSMPEDLRCNNGPNEEKFMDYMVTWTADRT